MRLTRREWHALTVGGLVGLPLARLGDARAQASRIAGVRVGVQSYSFRDRPLDAAIAAMREVGLSFCELWQGHVETWAALGLTPPQQSRRRPRLPRDPLRAWRLEVSLDRFRDMRRQFDEAGVTLTAYNISFDEQFTDEETVRAFEMARALGVDVITTSSRPPMAARVAPFADRFGVTVAFHNHSPEITDELVTPDDFAAAMSASDRIAANLDVGHFTASNFDALDYLDQFHDRIVSLHLKDRRRNEGATVPFGQGDAPLAEILRRLRDRGWDIPAHIEYEYRGADTIEEVRRSLDFCRRVLLG